MVYTSIVLITQWVNEEFQRCNDAVIILQQLQQAINLLFISLKVDDFHSTVILTPGWIDNYVLRRITVLSSSNQRYCLLDNKQVFSVVYMMCGCSGNVLWLRDVIFF